MKKIQTWRVYEVQNPGDLDQTGKQKPRAFIALGQGHNPYQTYGLLATTSYKNNQIDGELIINDLLKNKKTNKLLPNNLVRIYNSHLKRPFKNQNGYINITSNHKKIIIEHFKLQKYRKIKEFKFHSLDQLENIDYNYQANSLVKGIDQNINEAYKASKNLLDQFNQKYVASDNTITLDHKSFNILNKAFEELPYYQNELAKTHKKIQHLEQQVKAQQSEIIDLQNKLAIEVSQDDEMEIE
ncbi:hypothetical protein [Spiroplasma sp. SV19]|uniref:hypothetical protein n=1 Tax=Spiroplasma sp. SV19 TaxID=2570468 RepID=UPI0024B6F1BE|nr:hypothetical protein [Spiroplasma sp. SV19]WHQ37075.1 hypothetical protein E7Y35_04155 [Spiroplasma sp. SV19]